MFKYIKQFFLFLLPIVKTSFIQVAADELTKMAYPERKRRPAGFYGSYDPRTRTVERPRTARDAYQRSQDKSTGPFRTPEKFHDVLMVAFDITGPNAGLVHEWLENNMPPARDHGDVDIDAWWIADDAADSDCDSAVFVRKGEQETARRVLRDHGLVD